MRPTYFAVQRYLREFLSDRRVIDTPRLIWLPLLYGAGAAIAAPAHGAQLSQDLDERGFAPGRVFAAARRQDQLVAECEFKDRVHLELAMTYGSPNIARAIQSFASQGIDKLLVLPLYPQYCSSTTGSVVDGVNRALKRWRSLPEIRFINDYHDDHGFIEALSRKIREHWETHGRALAFAFFLSRHPRLVRGQGRSLPAPDGSDHPACGGPIGIE